MFSHGDPPSHRAEPGISWILLSHGKCRVAFSIFPHLLIVAPSASGKTVMDSVKSDINNSVVIVEPRYVMFLAISFLPSPK